MTRVRATKAVNGIHPKTDNISLPITNEEIRIPSYVGGHQPTWPSKVTEKTDIEALNLNWTEKELPERERTKHVHRLHPYLGKFIPQIVEVFLRKYFKPRQTVLDPFCGSGTTLVQANELGIHSVGFDISQFNVLLCKAKTDRYDIQELKVETRDIVENLNQASGHFSKQYSLFEQPAIDVGDEKFVGNVYLSTWYARQALTELLTFAELIDKGGYTYKDFFRVVLSRSARSARLTTHFDLDFPKQPQIEPYWCYKHSRICQPTTEALKFILRYSEDSLKRVEQYASLRTEADVNIYHADSRAASVPLIDGIITSPPYVGLIDYHDQHAYAYELLRLDNRQEEEIGPAQKGNSKKAQEKYCADIATTFRNALQSMRSGGHMVVIANDRLGLYDKIVESLDVDVEGVIQRHVNRRTGRRSSEYYESIFVWRKR